MVNILFRIILHFRYITLDFCYFPKIVKYHLIPLILVTDIFRNYSCVVKPISSLKRFRLRGERNKVAYLAVGERTIHY